jgi:hypothetical protein
MKPHTDQQSMILNDLTASRQKLVVENQQLRDELVEARMIIRLLKRKLEAQKNAEANNNVKRTTSAVTSQDTTVKAGTAVKQGSYFRPSLDNRTSQPSLPTTMSSLTSSKKRYLFKPKKVSWREAFMNPNVPGKKMFTVPDAPSNNISKNDSNIKNAVSLTPPTTSSVDTRRTATISLSGLEELSPRSSFTPIRRERSSSPPPPTTTMSNHQKVSKRYPSATRPQQQQQHLPLSSASSASDVAVRQITSRLQRATVGDDN